MLLYMGGNVCDSFVIGLSLSLFCKVKMFDQRMQIVIIVFYPCESTDGYHIDVVYLPLCLCMYLSDFLP